MHSSPDVGSVIAIVAEGITLLGGASAAYAYLKRPLRLQRLLRFRLRGSVDVVITTLTRPPSLVGFAPDDVHTTSRGNVIAAARWTQEIAPLKQIGKRATITTHLSEYLPEVHLTNDLIILGGNNENEIAQRFLAAVNARCTSSEVLYDDRDEARNLLRLSDGSGTVFDEEYPWIAEASEQQPSYDYGLIVAWRNPFSGERRRAVMCAGFTAVGTKAATNFFFDHVVPTRRHYAGWRTWPSFAVAWKMDLGPSGSVTAQGSPSIIQLREA